MSILGKILVVFNVLAALVFAYLAAVDWGQRHAWSWAVNSEEWYATPSKIKKRCDEALPVFLTQRLGLLERRDPHGWYLFTVPSHVH